MISTKALIKLAIFLCTSTAYAQNVAFDKAVPIKGDLSHFTTTFEDGFKIDLYSTADRTVTVSKKKPSCPASFVSQSGNWVALSDYSYSITTSDKAHNLVGAQISAPYKGSDVSDCQAFLGKLGHDGKTWMVFDGKAIHDSEGKSIGAVTQHNLDGEWMLLGRKNPSKFFNFGTDASSTFNVAGGEGRQKATWVDGLTIGVKSSAAAKVNVNIGASSGASGLPSGYQVMSPYAWTVKSSASGDVKAHMKVPFSKRELKKKLNIQKGEGKGKCVKVAVGCKSTDGKVAIAGHERPMPLGFPPMPWMFGNQNGTAGPDGFPFPPPPEGSGYPAPDATDAAAPPAPTGTDAAQQGQGRHGRHGNGHGHFGMHGNGHGGPFGHHKQGLGVWGLTKLDGTYFVMVNPDSIGDCKEMFKDMPHPWGPPGAGPDGPDGPEGPEPEGGDDDGEPTEGPDGGDDSDEPEPTGTDDAPTQTDAPVETGAAQGSQGASSSGYPVSAPSQAPAPTSAQAPASGTGYPAKRGLNRHVARRFHH